MNLKDKVVVITGGSKGFGKTLAEFFIREGSKVIINSNNSEEVKKVASDIGATGITADVTKEEELTELLGEVVKDFGVVDIWINNAGMWMTGLVEDVDMDKVRKMFEVNVIGTINGSRVALRYMKEKNSGTIINVISTAGLAERPTLSAYSATKWALNGFTKSIRAENKDLSILSIFPGGMKTDIFGESIPSNFNDFMETEYVANIVINNLKSDNPEKELVIQRPVN